MEGFINAKIWYKGSNLEVVIYPKNVPVGHIVWLNEEGKASKVVHVFRNIHANFGNCVVQRVTAMNGAMKKLRPACIHDGCTNCVDSKCCFTVHACA